ncbi:hypothetical protein [Colwellia sp. 75C3]|uniref:hypothetical protein n=1 Tax=Colwellia sp. 75C3 TaxID=888425 RepID=UPI0012FEA554|nr:hypothetical protein [Colwellia sp. 75C3]
MKYRCLIRYKPRFGGTQQVTVVIEAKNPIEARARAEGMYANTVSVNVTGTN